VRAGQSAGHARSLMEGLTGTAIRSAVRNPGCPQAPVLDRARRHLAVVRGLLLRAAQATTTHTGTNSSFRGCDPACRLLPGTSGWRQGSALAARVTPRVAGTGH